MLKKSIEYSLQRFTLFPWFLFPLYFIFLIFRELKHPALYISLLLFFFFFRLLDDYFCRHVDRARKPNFLPMLEDISAAIPLFGGIVSASFLLSWGEVAPMLMFLGFTVFSCLLYTVNQKTKLLEFVSLLKYPFIVLLMEYTILKEISDTSLFVFLAMLVPEVLEKKQGLSSRKTQMLQFFLLLLIGVQRYTKGL